MATKATIHDLTLILFERLQNIVNPELDPEGKPIPVDIEENKQVLQISRHLIDIAKIETEAAQLSMEGATFHGVLSSVNPKNTSDPENAQKQLP